LAKFAISNPEHIIDPSNKEKRIEDNDDISKCLSSHFSRIGKDSTVNRDFRKYVLNYVEEKQVSIGNDEAYLPVVFNNESISVTLKSLKSGKAPGVDDISILFEPVRFKISKNYFNFNISIYFFNESPTFPLNTTFP
jgi:hypothetical protein